MRKLSRDTGGQIQASSDPQIKRDLKQARHDLYRVQILGDEPDLHHIINAWLWGMARLPDPWRRAMAEVFVRDLERWLIEKPMLTPDELLAAVRAALVPTVVVHDPPVERRKKGVVEGPGGDDRPAVPDHPRPCRAKK